MSEGLQLTFYTQAERSYDGTPVYEWLIEQAKQHSITGATVVGGFEGVGHDGQAHTTNWFDSSDQPIRVIMVMTAEKSNAFLSALKPHNLHIFYTESPVQFGYI